MEAYMVENIFKKKHNIKFHKDTFDKTSADRRQKVLEAAIDEFASKGYNATNINDVAKKSNISIGSMYSYFASKEDLFLSIINNAYILLEKIVKDVTENSRDIFDYIERMLIAARVFAIKHPQLNQIYLDITTQALSQMSCKLSNRLETITSQRFNDVIKQAKEEGKISNDIDEKVIAYCIDNLLMMYQFSFSSDYYKERMKIFLGEERLNNIESIEQSIMKFIRSAIAIK
jgi:TetR/AcrR family transcriptional regulator